ncbi:MAG: hypothetical protein A2664_01810 [Candidatus Taylorbacteria bacterium RIFCSPHIGHO2_01_FULL_46_22b]|uniref:Uncharacterized protein n=1 Tax=Candidatus Taylorbacteria bacterium RIFCSPHIGHO2_01_FULL_46_22b TaxID=1802301 RepID=A0A1G2M2Q7_9BACT|nr:MAG: hypothetical protein A2664_01810 [Candidatus Taylorbacteria bacterium RIFCSPHIGHO2_01_FULL_46_22b]
MSLISTRNKGAALEENWVMYGKGGTLSSIETHLDIQHYLKKAAHRLKQQLALGKYAHPELRAKE